jgi:hypothetical protein
MPSAEGWTHIEQAYGCEFTEKDCSDIREIVDSFLFWHRFEKAAPFLDHVILQIENVDKAARNLNRVLSRLFRRDGPDPEAAFQAEIAIEQAWPGSDGLDSEKLRQLASSACGLILACTHTRKTLEENAGAREGQAWELMIRQLAAFANERGVPVTVRKDAARQADVKHSPLVAFVKTIQDQFPPNVPIRFSREDSLAHAINRVLHQLRERGIDLKRDPPKQIPHLG